MVISETFKNKRMAEPSPGSALEKLAGLLKRAGAEAVEPAFRERFARRIELSSEALSRDKMGQVGQHSKDQIDEDDDADDADDLDFNPLFLRDSEEEESEDEEVEEVHLEPNPLHALLDETLPSIHLPAPSTFLPSPCVRAPVSAVGRFSPGPSAFRLFGLPQPLSPEQARGPSDGTPLPLPLPLPLPGMPALSQAELPATDAQGEAVDGPAKRTRAQVSLAELTMEELETFLQDDEDDFFPGIDDDEEYERFLASISSLDEVAGSGGDAMGAVVEDEDDDDVDFVAEEEDAGEEEEEEGQSLIRKRKSGRPRGSRIQKAAMAEIRAAALRRPLAIKPSSLDARFHQMVCHVPSQDGRLRPMLMLKPITAPPPPPPTLPRFTSHQVGQLYCQILEHVQLLLQLYCVTCLGPPPSRTLASQCRAHLEALASARERVLSHKQTAFPDRCFQPPCTRPSLHPAVLQNGHLTTAPWAPPLDGPVRSLLDVQPLRAVRDFLRDMTLVIAEIDREFPPSSGLTFPRASLKPLFPPHPDARPTHTPSQTIRSILTNQHNPAPLPHPSGGVSVRWDQVERREGPLGFHSSLLTTATQADALPARPPRSLFLDEGTEGAPTEVPTQDAGPTSAEAEPGSRAVVRGVPSPGGGTIPEELMKAAKPTLVAMALVAPIVSDLAQQRFQHAFNPALYPREPAPTARPRAFSEAEDELLALGIQEFNAEWERIRDRFLPTKTGHQIATRVKNRCSSQAPDNVVKQTRQRKTAPLSAQEKFFVDEGILHHGHDWSQLAAYVPRADPALLPKLYREACGLKSKVWKASFARNERRKRQRQRAATERAQQEAAAELRDLTTDGLPYAIPEEMPGSTAESQTPAEAAGGAEAAASLSVRGLFLEEAPADKATQQRQPAGDGPPAVQSKGDRASAVRSMTEAGMSGQQPVAKRQKGTPVLLPQGPPVLSAPCAQRLIGTRPPLRPLATQTLPAPQGHPILPVLTATAGAKTTQEATHRPLPMPPSVPHVRPPLPPATHPAATANPDSLVRRTIVVRPQARRAAPVTPLQQPMQSTTVNGFHSRVAGPGRPAEAASRAVPSPMVVRKGPIRAPQRPQGSQLHAVAGSHRTNGAPIIEIPPTAGTPLHVSPGGSAISETPPPPSANTVLPPPAQTLTASTAQRTCHASLPEISIAQSVPSTRAPPPPAPAVPSIPKPWKTRQRQPKAVKAQQKAREAEERRRKVEAKREADKKQAADKQGPGAPVSVPAPNSAPESGRIERRAPPQGRPPTVTVHTVRGSGGVTRITHIATGQRSQIHTVGPRPYALRASALLPPSVPGPIMPTLSLRPAIRTEHKVPPGLAMPHPTPALPHALPRQECPPGGWAQQPIPPPVVHGVQARGPVSGPPVMGSGGAPLGWSAPGQTSQQNLHAALSASETSDVNGKMQTRHVAEMPVMETDELTDSDEDRWQHDEMPDGDFDARPSTDAVGGSVGSASMEGGGVERRSAETESESERERERERGLLKASAEALGERGIELAEVAELEDGGGKVGETSAPFIRHTESDGGERALPGTAMERDELTDSDEEADGSRDMLRGFFLEQDEMTESDEEEDETDERGGGTGLAAADGHKARGLSEAAFERLDDWAAPTNAEPSQKTCEGASGLRLLLDDHGRGGQASGGRGRDEERRVTFEKDELEDSGEEDEGGGPGRGVDEDELTESDEEPG